MISLEANLVTTMNNKRNKALLMLNIIYYSYETSDGVSRSESAVLKNQGTENEALSVRGTVSWTADDGQIYTLNYVADENGFQPSGAHLPVA